MSSQDELDRDAERWRELEKIEANAESKYPLSRIADQVNTGLMVVLVGFYLGSRLLPQYAIPDVATAFPYVGAFSIVVLLAAWGVDTGILPTPGVERRGGGR